MKGPDQTPLKTLAEMDRAGMITLGLTTSTTKLLLAKIVEHLGIPPVVDAVD